MPTGTQLSDQPKSPRVILAMSTGRTGTKAFATHAARCYFDVHAVHEPSPTLSLRFASTRFLCGKISKAQLAERLHKSRRRILERTAEAIYLESNPVLCGFLDVLDDVFHHPLILHIVRDPRTYVRSAINFGSLSGLRGMLTRYLPYWIIKPELISNSNVNSWSRMSDLQRLCWYWSAMNRHLQRGEELFGSRYRRVTFEDLFNPVASTLKGVEDWCGFTSPKNSNWQQAPRKVNASQKGCCGKFAEWSSADTQYLWDVCGEQMVKYGYCQVGK